MDDQAIIEAAQRFASGDVKDQSKKFAPSTAEFVEEVRRRQEYLDLASRPRLAPPVYRRGPLAPFEIKRQQLLSSHAHLPVLFEDISMEQFKRLSGERQLPVGSVWVAALGIVFGPEPKKTIELEAAE